MNKKKLKNQLKVAKRKNKILKQERIEQERIVIQWLEENNKVMRKLKERCLKK
jgi:ribosomal protein L16 Arg81 hydroxylase